MDVMHSVESMPDRSFMPDSDYDLLPEQRNSFLEMISEDPAVSNALERLNALNEPHTYFTLNEDDMAPLLKDREESTLFVTRPLVSPPIGTKQRVEVNGGVVLDRSVGIYGYCLDYPLPGESNTNVCDPCDTEKDIESDHDSTSNHRARSVTMNLPVSTNTEATATTTEVDNTSNPNMIHDAHHDNLDTVETNADNTKVRDGGFPFKWNILDNCRMDLVLPTRPRIHVQERPKTKIQATAQDPQNLEHANIHQNLHSTKKVKSNASTANNAVNPPPNSTASNKRKRPSAEAFVSSTHDGHESVQQDKRKRKRERPKYIVPESEREYVTVLPKDVKFGRGPNLYTHEGNQDFHKFKKDLQSLYKASSKQERTNVAQMLADLVEANGGRFLENARDEKGSKHGVDRWYVVHPHRARDKCSQALREDLTPEDCKKKRDSWKEKKKLTENLQSVSSP